MCRAVQRPAALAETLLQLLERARSIPMAPKWLRMGMRLRKHKQQHKRQEPDFSLAAAGAGVDPEAPGLGCEGGG